LFSEGLLSKGLLCIWIAQYPNVELMTQAPPACVLFLHMQVCEEPNAISLATVDPGTLQASACLLIMSW
jgi:hypothetical protein